MKVCHISNIRLMINVHWRYRESWFASMIYLMMKSAQYSFEPFGYLLSFECMQVFILRPRRPSKKDAIHSTNLLH